MNDIAETIIASAKALPVKSAPVLIAIDGRCSAGKTTLAEYLHETADWSVIHTDDFFPRPEQRTKERLETPGGNIDYERFLEEVLIPLKNGDTEISFRSFDCRTMRLTEPQHVKIGRFCVIEGSYSCHPALREHYDLRVFLSVSPEEQTSRIIHRNGKEKAALFAEKWIPMEEKYFSACETESICDLKFKTDSYK